MLTKQAIYDRVKTHLLTQMKKAKNSLDDCAYRADDGCKCAIGCLIPDHLYKSEWDREQLGIVTLFNRLDPIDIFGEELANDVHIGFMMDLQSIHDLVEIKNWAESLEEFARDHSLIA